MDEIFSSIIKEEDYMGETEIKINQASQLKKKAA
jgi:hypothetical protein